jgi:glycolate oxidase iron-sulfur subunit
MIQMSEPFPNGTLPDEAQVRACIRCGLCSAVCPVYQQTLLETDAPRGRIALVRAVLEGRLRPGKRFKKVVYECLYCQACTTLCPAGVRTDLLMMAARAYLLQREGENPVRRFLFRWLLPRPQRLETLTAPLRWYQHLGLRSLVEKLHLDRLLPRSLREMSWLLPPIPRRPERRLLPEVTPAQGERRHRAGFFLGCAQDVMFASASEATVRVLARNGCEVVSPQVACCGMPHLGYGELEVAKELARQNIAAFEDADVEVVVTDCASCGAQLAEYGELLAGEPAWAERARAFAHKVRDVSAYLMQIGIEPPRGRVEMRVTYHDPCHLVRAQKVTKEPRQLLRMIPGLEYVEMPEADWCCGNAGSHAITDSEGSGEILDRKMANAARTQAEAIVSGCPGCQMQLWRGVRRAGLEMQVLHLIELLDRAYREGDGRGKSET